MSDKRNAAGSTRDLRVPVIWALFAVISVLSLYNVGLAWANGQYRGSALKVSSDLLFQLLGIVFGLVGALIVSRQPRNVVGWLSVFPAISGSLSAWLGALIGQIPAAPSSPSWALLLALWFNGISWAFLIFPLFLLPLFFPTGRPLTRRWGWVALYIVLAGLGFIIVASLVKEISANVTGGGPDWSVANPIGILPNAWLEDLFNGPGWGLVLASSALLPAISLIVRYRRAGAVERAQIKWLLYASGLFVLIYVLGVSGFFAEAGAGFTVGEITNLLLSVGAIAIPIAIGISILRYRLFDIDIVIRRTLTYALVSGILVLVFVGSVILLQQVFAAITRAGQNELVTVLSTLAIAALFVPVRNRVQGLIDRRFNRKKYDAQKVLGEFAQTVRDETDLTRLTGRLVDVVSETMQPRSVGLWLKSGMSERARRERADGGGGEG